MTGVFNATIYGHNTWGTLFNSRQLLALITYSDLAKQYVKKLASDDREYSKAFAAMIGLVIDRLADLNAALCVWQLNTPNTAHVFGRWALPMVLDYGEVNPLAGAGGSPDSAVRRANAYIRDFEGTLSRSAQVERASATNVPLPDDSADFVFTDPPYYNAIPYADLMDFFYVWLKRSVGEFFPELFLANATPKEEEICEMAGWDPIRYANKDKQFFEEQMQLAFSDARRIVKPNGIGVCVFAHKTTAGWEAMLQALVSAGWVVTASWPIDTEMGSRLRAKNSAALASSVHIVMRPRENPDGTLRTCSIGDWRDVLQELPNKIHLWMPHLAEEGVVGADAIFACLGPALEIFSKYSRVEKADGTPVPLRDYLEQVWAAVSKEALNMVFEGADASGFEEDARLTAMWLWTITASNGSGNDEDQSKQVRSSGYSLEFDAARKIAQGLGAHMDGLPHLVEIKGNRAKLLAVAERTKHLFGKEEAPSLRKRKTAQQADLFAELEEVEEEIDWGVASVHKAGETALDRLHQSMILFAAGQSESLKRFIVEDGAGGDSRFWRLAQALSTLYPVNSDEKRWVDGVLARKKSLGF